MTITAGIDVGSGAIKAVVMRTDGDGPELLGTGVGRIRRRKLSTVADNALARAIAASGVDHIDYIATTGEGEDIPYATGHFYGMTTHARGALFLVPDAVAVLDVGALHARAVHMDPRGKVLRYKMTSQCASGSGQFLENISRYLGVTLSEVGSLSLQAKDPEAVSSICAVLAETDVINMVSRGIAPADILRGIHESMAGRFARLLRNLKVEGIVCQSGGLALDQGLQSALQDALDSDKRRKTGKLTVVSHPDSIHAGAIGAAIWGGFRHGRLGLEEPAWQGASGLPQHATA